VRGGELDCQRQPVEAAADLGYRGQSIVARGEFGLDGASAFDEKLH
jgi:hypothetical protein